VYVLAAVAGESKTRKARFGSPGRTLRRRLGCRNSLGIVPADNYELTICASRYAGFQTDRGVRSEKRLLHIIDLPVGAHARRLFRFLFGGAPARQ